MDMLIAFITVFDNLFSVKLFFFLSVLIPESLTCNEAFTVQEFPLLFLLTPTYRHGQQTGKD